MSELGKNIKELRRSHKLSLDKMAANIGISKTHLWSIEEGKSCNPSVHTVIAISRLLDVSVDELLAGFEPLEEYAKACQCGSVNFALRRDGKIECNSCGDLAGVWKI